MGSVILQFLASVFLYMGGGVMSQMSAGSPRAQVTLCLMTAVQKNLVVVIIGVCFYTCEINLVQPVTLCQENLEHSLGTGKTPF